MKKDKNINEELQEKEECNCDNCNCSKEECDNDECCCDDGTCNCSGDCCNEHNEEHSNEVKLQEIIDDLQNKLLYKDAELINYRRRKDEEVSNMLKYANQDLILDILPVVDNFERAIKSFNGDSTKDNSMLTGINMIYNGLVDILKKYGVTEINESNIPFDHNIHNAVMTDTVDNLENDIVLEILMKGYKLKDRVIRPAMVKVNNK